MPLLPACSITAWSWANAASSGTHDDPRDEDPWSSSGLAEQPASLGLSGSWGRLPNDLARLPEELLRHDSRCAQLLVHTARPMARAIEQAVHRFGKERVAVVLGSSTGGIDATERALQHERAHGTMPEDFVFEEAHVYHALVRVLRVSFGLGGPGYVVSTACSSAAKAMASAQRLIATGEADAVVSGGVDALCEMTLRGFGGLGILSKTGCRPFDAARDGISIGEGAALLLLERDTPSRFCLLSAGESSDAYHLTAPHPDGHGARLAMTRALAEGGLSPADVDYVNAHGTGTPQNDRMEARAITDVLGEVPFSSSKDRTGHQLGTAGATEAIFCLEAMARGRVPENRAPDAFDDTLAAQPVCDSKRAAEVEPRVTLSNSFAFGGSNVCLALADSRVAQAPRQQQPYPEPDCPLYVRGVAAWAPGRVGIEAVLGSSPGPVTAPSADILQRRARGRASLLTRMFAELYSQLLGSARSPRFDASQLPLVCGSAYGEMATTIFLLDQMQHETTLSPARFQASVHNTAAGLLSIATGNREFSTALAAGDATVAMTLLEARAWLATRGGDVIALVADEEGPSRLLRGESFPPLGLGLHLSSRPHPEALGCLHDLRRTGADCERPSGVFSRAPAAWGLPLFRQLLRGHSGVVELGEGWSCRLRAPASRASA